MVSLRILNGSQHLTRTHWPATLVLTIVCALCGIAVLSPIDVADLKKFSNKNK